MKILVSGGSGFIGSHLIDFLLQQPEVMEVINVDVLTYAGSRLHNHLAETDPRYMFEEVDIRWRELAGLFEEYHPDWVFHLAAETHVDNSIAKPHDFITTNVIGTYQMLVAAEISRVWKFLHVSTDEVYGSVPAGQYAAEFWPFRPSSPYSASKASADLLVQAWIKTYGFPALIVRPANAYGPRQHPEKLIPKTIQNILTGQPIPLYGHGQQIRDWLYVQDLVQGLWAVMTKGQLGEAYNLPGHMTCPNLELVHEIQHLMNPFSQTSPIEFVADRPGHDFRYAMDGGKGLEQTGWEPTTELTTGLTKTLGATLQNKACATP